MLCIFNKVFLLWWEEILIVLALYIRWMSGFHSVVIGFFSTRPSCSLVEFYVVHGQISIQSKADRDPHSDILDFFCITPFSVIFYSANSNGLSCPKLLKSDSSTQRRLLRLWDLLSVPLGLKLSSFWKLELLYELYHLFLIFHGS